MIKKLSRNEFEDAIKKGLGRAALHAQHYGLEGIDDIMLNACLHDLSYDPQCSDERAQWPQGMIKNSSFYDDFVKKIALALEQAADDDESHDCKQICELLAEMGQQGDNHAAQALRQKVYQPKNALFWRKTDYWHFIEALIKLDGVKAYVWFAEQLGTAILSHEEDADAIKSIFWHAEIILYKDNEIREKAFFQLQQFKDSNPAIAAFIKHEQTFHRPVYKQCNPPTSDEKRWQRGRTRMLKKTSLQKILDADVRPARNGFHLDCALFGQFALSEELEAIYQKLINETDEKLYNIWICVFSRAPLPRLHPRIWEMAFSSNNDLRQNTLLALSQVDAPSVGKFVRKIIRSKNTLPLPYKVIQLFTLNYEQGDEKLILETLQNSSFDTDDDLHRLSGDIADILKNNDAPALFKLALWFYETTPCEVCRLYAVEWMVDQKLLPEHIRQECLHDTNEEIRRIAFSYPCID